MKKNKVDNITIKTAWHNKTLDQTLKEINSSANGLTSAEAVERASKYGKNTLPKKRAKSIILMFLEELINPIVLILLAAMAFSFIVGDLLEGFVVLGIVMIDATIGTIQSKRAERVASSLS